VHFATHGALAGELKVGAEPGLILTPPKEQSDSDDGYLSASEVGRGRRQRRGCCGIADRYIIGSSA
jgi:hypothetical protein